jgi:hypothetical protein
MVEPAQRTALITLSTLLAMLAAQTLMLVFLASAPHVHACADSCDRLDWKWLPLACAPETVLFVGGLISLFLSTTRARSLWRVWKMTLGIAVASALALPVLDVMSGGFLVRGIPWPFIEISNAIVD